MYVGLHAKYLLLLSDFNETWIFSTDFRKIPKHKISWKIRPVEAEVFQADSHTDEHTDMTKQTVAFRNFANAPKITRSAHSVHVCILYVFQQNQCLFPYKVLI